MNILGIETSCDETAAAVVKDGRHILSNVIASSADMHVKYGGVVPEQAARQQIKSIIPTLDEALGKSSLTKKSIGAIAVTIGPGLIGSLLVGVEAAKTLATLWEKPLIPVNHLIGHIYANWLGEIEPQLPALALVVSGGHTDLVLLNDHGKIEWIGGTRDDAAGEAFDKTARLLGLPYPGGPNLSKLADDFLAENKINLRLFPRPMVDEDNFDWSFSGLKTAVLNKVRTDTTLSHEEIAANVQEAIVDSLVTKTMKAIELYQPKSFLLGGGVAANQRLKGKFESELVSSHRKIAFHVPEAKLCTDNAAYIAGAAFYNHKSVNINDVVANPQLRIVD